MVLCTPSARPTGLQEQAAEGPSTLVLLDQLALVQFLMGSFEPAEKTLQRVLRSGPVAANPQLSAVAQLRLGSVMLGESHCRACGQLHVQAHQRTAHACCPATAATGHLPANRIS